MIMTLASLALVGVLLVLSWDEDDKWKVFACYLIFLVASIIVRTGEYKEGYENATCDVYEAIDRSDKANVQNIPEFCEDGRR